MRSVRGPMADWTLEAQLLRNIEFGVRGLQWQNSGGKGGKPKPIDLPDRKKPKKADGADVARRLRNLGLIPAGDDTNPPPAAVSTQ